MNQKISKQLEITVYPRKDSSIKLSRSKTVDYEQGYTSIPLRYLNPRVVSLLNQDHLDFKDNTKPPDKQSAKENELQATPKQNEQEQKESIGDERRSEEKEYNCLKPKKLQFKQNNIFDPNLEQKIVDNSANMKEFKLQENLNQQKNQLEIKENNNNNNNSSNIGNSNNGRIADEQGSLYLQQEYSLRSVSTFELKIKSHIVDFSKNRYYRFLLFKILENGLIQHKEWLVFTFLREWQNVCCDQFGSKLFIECIRLSKSNWHRTEYYNDFVDLILRNQSEVNEIYRNRYGIKIIRDCLVILDNEDLSNLLTKINIMLFNPFESENIGNLKGESPVFLASEQFGCLIINTIVDNYANEEFRDSNIRQQVRKMLKRIVARAPQLAQNYYSNYMISNMLEKLPGTDIDKLLREALLPVITQLSIDKFSSNVVEVAIKRGDEMFLERIWRILSELNEQNEPETFEILVNDQFANYVVQSFYETVRSPEIRSEFEQLLSQLHSSSKLLSNSGQHVKGQIIDKKRKYLYPKKQQQQSHQFPSQSYAFHRQQSDYSSEEFGRFAKPPGFSSEESSSCSNSMLDSNPDFSRQNSSNMFASSLSQTDIPNTVVTSNTATTNNSQLYLQKSLSSYQTQQKYSENINHNKDNNFPRKQYYQQQQQQQQSHDNHRQYQHYQQHRQQEYQHNNMQRQQGQQDMQQQKHLESSSQIQQFTHQKQVQQQQHSQSPSPFVSPQQQAQQPYVMMVPIIKPIGYAVNYMDNNSSTHFPQTEWKPPSESVSGLAVPPNFQQTSYPKMSNELQENSQYQQQQFFKRTPIDQLRRNQYLKYSTNSNNQKLPGNHQYQQQQLQQPFNQHSSVQTLENQNQVVS